MDSGPFQCTKLEGSIEWTWDMLLLSKKAQKLEMITIVELSSGSVEESETKQKYQNLLVSKTLKNLTQKLKIHKRRTQHMRTQNLQVK
jgi:hypothetical protein